MKIALAIAALLVVAWAVGPSSKAKDSSIPAGRAVVVAACGTAPWTYTAGNEEPLTMNTSGQLCTL